MKKPNDTEYLTIKGGGGGGDAGAGGAGGYTNTPDTLRSTDSFEILLGLGSGRWKGLTNGLKSLYINDVPLENTDGTSNFKDITSIFADGDPAQEQTVTFKLGGGGGITGVNTQLTNTNTTQGVPGNWVSGATTTPNADFIDFRFVVQQLFHSKPTGTFEATADIELQMRPQGGTTWYSPLVQPGVPSSYDPGTGGYPVTPTPSDGQGSATYTVYQPRERVVSTQQARRPQSSMSGTGGGSGGATDPFASYARSVTNNDYATADGGMLPVASGTNRYISITGKTMSTFVKEVRISVPKAGAYENKTWEFRARLIQQNHEYVNENTDDQEEYLRTIVFESATAVIKQVLGFDEAWRGLVWMQVIGKASDQLSGFPAIKGIYDTKIVKVPPATVFNPDTRQYTGSIWDGSFASAYTNDPAWCIKDLIEDNISGIAAISPGATLDKWDALDASKYASQLVPDGRGGTHPRFSMNLRIENEMNAQDLIQYMAGAFNGLCVDTGGGKWKLKIDKPETPTTTFTLDNIIGDFQYSHTDIDTRYNDITLTFLNEETNYQEDRLRVYDEDHIAKYGRKPTTIVAVGATNRQEVLRRGVLRLRTSLNETKIVKFTTNRQGKLLEPLQTILIADQALGYTPPTGSGTLADFDPYDNRTTSRISSMNTAKTQITLGRSVRLEPNVTYKVKITIPNPNYNPDTSTQPSSPDWKLPTVVIERTLTNTTAQRGDVTVLYLDSALPVSTPPNAVIALSADGMPTLPVQYRIIDLAPTDNEVVGVTAMIVDSGKYLAADNATTTDIDAWIQTGKTGDGVTTPLVPAPTVPSWGMFKLSAFNNAGQQQRILSVNWVKPAGSTFIRGYLLEERMGRNAWRVVTPETNQTMWEITDPTPGRHDYRVRAIDATGAISSPLVGGYDVPALAAGVGIPHSYGNFADRPTTDMVVGQLYTAEDRIPVITYRWNGTAWVIVSSAGSDVNSGGDWGGTGSIGIIDSGDTVTPTRRLGRGELRTILGTAAAIDNQGYFATRNTVGYGDTALTGFGILAGRNNARFGNEIYRFNGTTLVNDSDAITSLGTALGINNQGRFATRNTIGYGDPDLTGFGGLAARNNARFGNEIYRFNGTTLVNDSDAITSLGTALGINNQGRFATRNTIGYGDPDLTGFGGLAARNNARLGNEIYRFNGTTLVNDSDAITSLGTALGINNQGRFATRNSIGYGDPDLTGFGNLAGRNNARFGFEVYRADSTTQVQDQDAITSLGTALGINNQGRFATRNTIGYGDPDLTGFGGLAARNNVSLATDVIDRYTTNISEVTGRAFAAESGADITGGHTAAGFQNQGTLATRNTARLGTDIEDSGTVLASWQLRNARTANNVTYVVNPDGASVFKNTGAATGAIRIDLPQALGTNTMIKMQVEVYNFNAGGSTTYLISGNNFTSWRQTSAQVIGDKARSLTVRYGVGPSGKASIWIGEPTTTWAYPNIRVAHVQLSYSNYELSKWESGWNIDIDASAATSVSSTITQPTAGPTFTGNNIFASDGNTLTDSGSYGIRTSLNTASGISNQGTLATRNNVTWDSDVSGRPSAITNLVDLGGTPRLQGAYIVNSSTDTSRLVDRWPQEGNANRTETRTAAAIASQGPWATESTPVNNVLAPEQNLLYNGNARLGNDGWSGTWGLSDGSASRYWMKAGDGVSTFNWESSPFTVTNGGVYTFSAEWADDVGAAPRVRFRWINSSGGEISNETYLSGGVSNWARLSVTSNAAPAGAVQCIIRIYITNTTTVTSRFRNAKVERGSTATPWRDDQTNSSDRLTNPGWNYRLADGRNQTSNQNFGLRSLYNNPTFTGSDNGTSAKIDVTASSFVTDWGTTINFPSTSITGLAFSTKYYIWRNQANPTTSGESYGWSTSLSDAVAPGKVYMGYCTTPADGGGSTGGGGPGLPDCIWVQAVVPVNGSELLQADEVAPNDMLTVLDEETWNGTVYEPVQRVTYSNEECVTLTTESGIALTLSINTPITLKSRRIVQAPNARNEVVPVKDFGEFRWETVTNVEYAGVLPVAHIYVNQKTFASGNVEDRYILTHNPVKQ